MRTTIRLTGKREVTVTQADGTALRYWIPQTTSGYGYLRVGRVESGHDDAADRQVCESSGATVKTCPEALLAEVRRIVRRR